MSAMPTVEDPYHELLARAHADPAVLGLILTGSHARAGMAGVHSDRDVIIVVAELTGAWTEIRRSAQVDEIPCSLADLADTSDRGMRYIYRGAEVLLDRSGGEVTRLVDAQATPTPQEATAWAHADLDAYVNQIYRVAKNRRDGRPALAQLDAMESAQHFLAALFALHGRIRPFNKYLQWELETYPLGEPWDAATFPERLAADPVALFPDLAALARARGHGDVLDSWGDDLDLLPSER